MKLDFLNDLSCGKGISQREIKYSISTITLFFTRAFSEKYSERTEVFEKYLPSIGEIAFKDSDDIT
tara:strand:+ start:35 stop:232 length:198 start_codon:yes stop_codon:yes gene_type:complete